MFNSILNFVFFLIAVFVGLYWLPFDSTKWKELLEKYGADKHPHDAFFMTQVTARLNGTAIRGLNLGVSDGGLFLSQSPLFNFFASDLIIPWDDISYERISDSSSRVNYLIL